MLKPLPVGIQTFSDLIEGGFLYVDKTRWVYEMLRYPKGVYFLSRPRRFGKSLLLSMLEAIFQGQRELFEGLWIAITIGRSIRSCTWISACSRLRQPKS